MAAIACTEKPEIIQEPVSDTRTVTLNASLHDTRVAVDGEGKTTWTAGDAIAVWNTEGTKFQFDIESGAGTETATFKCTTFEGTLGAKAVYPYEWAGAAAGTVTIPEYIAWVDGYVPAVMASTVSEITAGEVAPLYFHSLMAIMEFTLQDVPAYACAFKLWSKLGADLHGTWTVSADCTSLTDITTGGNTQQVIYFPYKTAYGAEATMKIRAAVPAYSYTDLKIRVLDGDETVIDGTAKVVPTSVTSRMGDNLNAYVTMPTLNVRSLVGSARDKYVIVNKTKWAKGNLLCKEGTTTEGFQENWSITGSQEEYYSSMSNTCIDHFNWGGIGRASRFSSAGYMQPAAGTTIEGKIYSDVAGTALVEGEGRFVNNGLSTNTPLYGDLAFWASKGTYRLPTVEELSPLNISAAGQKPINVQFGSYNSVNGVLFTTSFRGKAYSTYSTTSVVFDEADIESGLFLPKAGRRFIGYWQNSGGDYTWTWNSSSMNITAAQAIGNKNPVALTTTNAWGIYWSSRYSTQNHSDTGNSTGFYDNTATILWLKGSSIGYGYTQDHANSNCNINGSFNGEKQSGMQVSMGASIRPVYIGE